MASWFEVLLSVRFRLQSSIQNLLLYGNFELLENRVHRNVKLIS